jgi:hypothetical protein
MDVGVERNNPMSMARDRSSGSSAADQTAPQPV